MLTYAKIRDVKSPCRAHDTDAGIDLFIPQDFMPTEMKAGVNITIPMGIKVNVPKGFALIVFNKSGVPPKKGIMRGSCVIDHGYQGELMVNLIKVCGEPVTLLPGEKIVQVLLIPIDLSMPIEKPENELYEAASARGTGGFGSTGIL